MSISPAEIKPNFGFTPAEQLVEPCKRLVIAARQAIVQGEFDDSQEGNNRLFTALISPDKLWTYMLSAVGVKKNSDGTFELDNTSGGLFVELRPNIRTSMTVISRKSFEVQVPQVADTIDEKTYALQHSFYKPEEFSQIAEEIEVARKTDEPLSTYFHQLRKAP